MRWYPIVTVAAVAGRLAAFDMSAAAGGDDEGVSARLTRPAAAALRAPVLRREEPRDSVMVRLPGPAAKAAPVVKPAPVVRPFIPPPVEESVAAPVPLLPEPPLSLQFPVPVSKLEASAFLPPTPLLPAAKETATAVPAARAAPKGLPKRILPVDFERDSALFCQRRISQWMQPDAYNIFGEALRDRPAYDDDRKENGRIYAFADPSGRYRELELDFAADTGILRSVFVYPWKMTWQDCRRQWGGNVAAADASKGRKFYSYLNRRLDVLVDAGGRVISLGLY